jgi:hypothetical protein
MGRPEIMKPGGSFSYGLERVSESGLSSGAHILKENGRIEIFWGSHLSRIAQRLHANYLGVGRHVQSAEKRKSVLVGGI